jgi:hypothetical protein
MLRTDDSAAYASNWRAVLAVDGAIGVIISLVGVVLALLLAAVVGLLVIALGAAYAALVVTRARRWSRLRRDAGL